ncbi:hypothetical protein M413DRAFT_327728 [Hebeloma cylindrosporum]|uniref:Uncharacterized protein n=1 Tax=Hebeloma cylindrosporum TaxID=76867 RepID=A0A0C2YVL8_HEBCY|nr:hypothetical protein M413DRAFT_327728 [Hebeloma cylindrosporum h7]
MIAFSRFRQLLCFVLAVTAAISLTLGIYYWRFFLRPGVAWLVVSVEGLSLIRSTWSLIRKPAFAIPQPVASEAIGLFVLFPFHLIIALLISTLSAKHGNHDHNLGFTMLRVFTMSGAILHMIYTIGLVAIAVLTVPAFDPDVWLRDVDSTPSPFPLAIIFAFAFPCLARRFESTRAFVRQSALPGDQCLPTCLLDCNIHGAKALGRVVPARERVCGGHQCCLMCL